MTVLSENGYNMDIIDYSLTPIKFLVFLALTIVIQAIVAFIIGYRNKNSHLALFVANCILKPLEFYLVDCFSFLINHVFSLIYTDIGANFQLAFMLLIQIPVIWAEWKILLYLFEDKSKPLLKLSIIVNISIVVIIALLYYILTRLVAQPY